MYWARTRVLEYLSKITPQLPPDVKTELGPDATSVGWVFQYALVDKSRQAPAGRAALLPGLVPALRRAERAGRLRGGDRGRPGAPVPGDGEPQHARELRAVAGRGDARGAPGQQRRGRTARRARRARVHGARPRLREERGGPREAGPQGRGRHARHGQGRGQRDAGPRDAPRHRRPRRRGRRGGRHRGHAPGGERPQRHRARQGEARGAQALAARRASRWSPPTTARTSSSAPSTR